MPYVNYRRGDVEIVADVPEGTSLMQAAVDLDIDGIVGECGGNAMCATCHVYVAPEVLSLLPAMADDEDEMLRCTTSERRPNSRLSCQIRATADLGGIVVDLPDEQ